jgi:ankyrin repeat protein
LPQRCRLHWISLKFHRLFVCAALACTAAAADPQPPSPAGSPGNPADAQIVQAAARGDASELRQLLEHGGSPRAAGPSGTPAIGYALLSKNPQTFGVLLQADPSLAREPISDSHGKTHPILLYAASLRQPAMVAALLHSGADARAADADGVTVLEYAAVGADAQSLQLLIEAGANPNQRDIYGHTPLMQAAGAGNLDAARTLLDHGALTYPLDTAGSSALTLAQSRLKDPEAAKAMADLLASHGAPAGGKNRPVDDAYLDAVHAGDQAGAESALGKGADVNARRKFTMDKGFGEPTALAVPYPKLLAYLLDHGADINAASDYGFNALHVAAGRPGNHESLELLVKRGADINRPNRNGQTPIAIAVNDNQPSTVELLLRLGAKPTGTGPGGLSLLDLARLPNHSALLVPMLEKAGAAESPAGTPAPCVLSTQHVTPCALLAFVRIGNYTVVKKAIDEGIDLTGRDEHGAPLLSVALALPVRKTSMGIVVADDDATTSMIGRRKQIAHALLEHGADVTIADSLGFTALHWVAADSRIAEFLEPLIQKGAPLNAVAGTNHVTPLLGALDAKNAGAAAQLVRAGADPNIPMARGITPLMAAAFANEASVGTLLLEKGARIDAVSESRLTALKAAVSANAAEFAAMLLKAGASADFDAGAPPSPRAMSKTRDAAMQALFATAPAAH